jgi:hypothetical protein
VTGTNKLASGASMSLSTVGQKRLVIVGATGMVGGYALRYALENPAVGSVTSIGRKKLGISHPQAERGRASKLRRLFPTCRCTLGPGRNGVLPGHIYGNGAGCGAPHHNGGLHDRVRASSPQQQPRRGILILERERRRPDRTKPACLRALQGRGREGTSRGGFSPRLPLPARVHLSHRAAEGAEFQLPAYARDLPRVSGAVPEPCDSGRRTGRGHGRCRCPRGRRVPKSGSREP